VSNTALQGQVRFQFVKIVLNAKNKIEH
jgi:hypothetical protein